MKDIVELDEGDIIQALSEYVAREKGWDKTGHAGLVSLNVTPDQPRNSARVSARVEKMHGSLVVHGKVARSPDPFE